MSKGSSKIEKVISIKHEFDPESQKIIDGMINLQGEHEIISSMKRTQGWKVIEAKIKSTLHDRILELVKDDPTIQVLLGVLTAADTKGAMRQLEAEVDELLPD